MTNPCLALSLEGPVASSEPLSVRREDGSSEAGGPSCQVETPNSEERKQRAERGSSLSKLAEDNQRRTSSTIATARIEEVTRSRWDFHAR